MAQVQQPGSTQNEMIDDDAKQSGHCHYNFTICAVKNSLYLVVKYKKTKRSFHSTFSQSTLIEMGLSQSIEQIVNLFETAKAGKKTAIELQVRYGNVENVKKVPIDKFATKYSKGSAMYIFILIRESWLIKDYCFKLIEQRLASVHSSKSMGCVINVHNTNHRTH